MARRRARRLGTGVLGAIASLALVGCSSGHAIRSAPRATVPAGAVRVSLGAVGRPIPRGFLGLSIEFQAIRAYTGSDPHAINPVFEALVRGLSPGQSPVIRIGGDSTDVAWVPAAGVTRPWFAGYTYPLTPGWLATTAAFAHDVDARMTLGLDLAADQPALDGAEARAFARTFGRSTIADFEVGNEPNLYDEIPQFTLADGRVVTARAAGYGPTQYRSELAATIAALPRADPAWTFAAPALAAGENPLGAGQWTRQMGALLAAEPAIRTLTVHRYPLKRCFTRPGSSQYPTIAHLLAPASSTGLAAGVRLWVRIAAAHGDTVRVDELNSVACRGKAGVSDTFASALWATDTLFALARAGVAGVNIHTLPDAAYAPFSFTRSGGRWRAHVLPMYYGLRLFAEAAPVGARLEAVSASDAPASLGVWATRAVDGTRRLVLINEDATAARTVAVRLPLGVSAATVTRLTAPGLQAIGSVSLGGASFGPSTVSGQLAAPRTVVAPRSGGDEVVVRVPAASAALVTFAPR